MSIFSELGVREGKDRLKEEVLYNLAACFAHIERYMAKVLAPHDLSTVKMNALMMVKHVGGTAGISQVDLAKKMIVSAGNITRLVDRLEKEKLIERVPRPGDRRVKVLKITTKGSRLMDKAWPIHKREVDKIVSLLPKSDIHLAKKVLSRFRERLAQEVKKIDEK